MARNDIVKQDGSVDWDYMGNKFDSHDSQLADITNSIPITTVDDTDISLTFNGTFTHSSDVNYYNSTKSTSNATNANILKTFYGTGIKVYDAPGLNRGIIEIFIDDVSQGTFDRYAATQLYNQLAFSKTGLSRGSHTIKINITGTKNVLATDCYFALDYLNIIDNESIASLTDKITSISQYNAKKDGGLTLGQVTGNASKLNTLLSLIGSNVASISFGAGQYRIDDNVTIPKNVTLKLDDGVWFIVDDSKILTITGDIIANRRQIFTYNITNTDITTSNIQFTRKFKVYPEWWGAITNDNTFDCRPSFKRMYASCLSGAMISLNSRVYYIADEIDPPYNDWSFQGKGSYFPTEAHKVASWGDNVNFNISSISFNSIKSNTHMLQFQPTPGGTGMIRNVELKNIAFYGLDGSQRNVAVTTGQKSMFIDFTGTNCNGVILSALANKIENVFIRGFSGCGIIDASFSKYTNVMIELCGIGIQNDATDSVFSDTHIYLCKNGIVAGMTSGAHYFQINTMRLEWCEEYGLQYQSGGNFHIYGLTVDACGYAGIAICNNNIDAGGTITNRNYLEALVTRCGRAKNGLGVSDLSTETDFMQGSNVYINKWTGGNIKITQDRKTDDAGQGMSPAVGLRIRNSSTLLIENVANNFTARTGNNPAISYSGLSQALYKSTGVNGGISNTNESSLTFDSSGNISSIFSENFLTWLIMDGFQIQYRGKIVPQNIGTESATETQFALPVHFGTPTHVDNGTMYWNSSGKTFYGCSEGYIEQLLGAREVSSLPTASSTQYWKMYKVNGGGTAEDVIAICLRHSDGSYYWKNL